MSDRTGAQEHRREPINLQPDLRRIDVMSESEIFDWLEVFHLALLRAFDEAGQGARREEQSPTKNEGRRPLGGASLPSAPYTCTS
jgi:hypothetical protein